MSLLVLLRGTAQGATLTIAPGTGHVVLTGKQATIVRTLRIAPGTGHSLLTGKQPSVTLSRVIAPSTGHASITGKQPSITRYVVIAPATGHVLYSGKQPTLGLSRMIAPVAGHVLFSGKTPGITQTKNQIIVPGTGRLTFSGHTPVVQYTRWPSPAEVLLGVQYGPTGSDFTGTAVASGGATGFASRMFVTLTTERLSVTEKPRKQAQQVVESATRKIVCAQSTQAVEPKLEINKAYVLTSIRCARVTTQIDEMWLLTNKEIL